MVPPRSSGCHQSLLSTPSLLLLLLLVAAVSSAIPTDASSSCPSHACQLLDPCLTPDDCSPGLYCGNCPSIGKNQPSCTRGQAIRPTSVVNGLPFNKYTWLVTHNSFSILNAPSYTGTQRLTFYNQEDSVTNQLMNGVRGLMLDMYDFQGDIWLCHSFQGQCYNFTAFEPAINTLKEVEAFLTGNPSEIVTIMIEDYVHVPKGLTKLFKNAGLLKYWFPVSEMPSNGADWPTVTYMISKNYRLLVFTSVASKEAEEGIAYQWRYMVENEYGDPGMVTGSCQSSKESRSLDSRSTSLFLQNYFPTVPFQKDACKEHSSGLAEMIGTCYKEAGYRMPNFLAVNYYMRSDGGGVFDILDKINGQSLCGCATITACKAGSSSGACKNDSELNRTSPKSPGGTYSGYIEFKAAARRSCYLEILAINLLLPFLMITILLL